MSEIFHLFGIQFDFVPAFKLWMLIFIRCFTMLAFVPFLGTRMVMPRARTTLALVAFYVFFLVQAKLLPQVPESYFLMAAYMAKEVLFGFTIGFVTQAIFYGIQAAGMVVDHQRGGANAQLVLPELGQVTIFGSFYYWMAIALFLSVGGHRFFLKSFFEGFTVVPLLSLPLFESGFAPFMDFIILLSGKSLLIALQLSAPVLIAVLLTDTVLGIANKMAPQINVFELGFAAKGIMGPLLVYVSLVVLVAQMGEWSQSMMEFIYQVHSLWKP